MASQILRPHRSPSPSPSPSPTINHTNPAKLTRQSLGPPTSSTTGAAKGFAGLGISASGAAPGTLGSHPRHVSSSVAMGHGRESLSPRPSLGPGPGAGVRAVSANQGGRPSSEFLPGREAKTPEAEQIDQWFKHLASWEATLEEMAAASTDQNFTEELGAIEQWFRVLSEAERTAALYSLLQHSTPVQIRFFLSVLHHMAQSDPMTALLSPQPPTAGMPAQVAAGLKSPSAGGGSGFMGSPNANQYLAPDEAKSKARQNRISAPGGLQPVDRWQGQLDQVIERGSSPGLDSNASTRSRSPGPDARPKSADYSGKAGQSESGSAFRRSPRLSSGVGLGIGHPSDSTSPVGSPFLNNGSWASMVNTPMVSGFADPKLDSMANPLNMANFNLANAGLGNGRLPLEDARKFRRPSAGVPAPASRNVSGAYNDDGEMVHPRAVQPGATSPLLAGQFGRSPVIDQFGLGGLGIGADPNALAGLGMNFANLGLNAGVNALNAAQAAQVQALAMQQLSTAASFAQGGYGGLSPNLNNQGPHSGRFGGGARNGPGGAGRRSPMLGNGKSQSPAPGGGTGGGGAGGGAGVAGPDDVDMKVLEDVPQWLRVLRLHKYTTTFESSNWKEMALMTDQDLQDKGISAQGARTKFLKVFYNVRTKLDIPHPAGQEEYAPGAIKEKEDK